MTRKLKIAAIQMDATPAPVESRLQRAADLVAEAASGGAQLVVLPEVFNTGYEYSDNNYHLPEPMDGQTVTWMKAQAAEHKVYLSGTFLHLDHDEVYNTALMVAPDGRTWRYDKNYPWAWERAYFREGQGITIADTELGKLGMMICWDYAHPELWARYAGRVDAMVIMSCPPQVDNLDVVYPDGTRLSYSTREVSYKGSDTPFGSDFDEQVAWMRVPAVNTTGSGHFKTHLPMAALSMAFAFGRIPKLLPYVLRGHEAVTDTGFYPQTKVIDKDGTVLSRVTESGDGFTIAEVELADTPPKPIAPQPKSAMKAPAYILSDWIAPAFTSLKYHEGLKRQYGEQMAPIDYRTKVWAGVVIAAGVMGWLLGKSRR